MYRFLKTNDQIIKHLKHDPLLYSVIEKIGDLKIKLSDNYYESLTNSIIGQQLSSKAASAIWERVKKLANSEITPDNINRIDINDFREAGVSYAKINYIKNLSSAVLENSLNLNIINNQSNDQIIKDLTNVKGIGRWTAEMFLIFSLGRQDIFSIGDLGLKRAMKWLYQMDDNPPKDEIIRISEQWKPYRTFASLYLWEIVDQEMYKKI